MRGLSKVQHIGFISCELTHEHGWAHYSTELIAHIHRAGVRVTVIAPRSSPTTFDFPVHPVLPEVNTHYMPLRLLSALPCARALLRDCDLLQVTLEPFSPLGAWVAESRPLFLSVHGSYAALPRLKHFPLNHLYSQSFRRAQAICVSRYTEQIYKRVMPGARSLVVHNGVNAARFAHLPLPPEAKRGPVVLAVGAVKARKGILELVSAMAVVRRSIPHVQCVIIGSLSTEVAYVTQVRAAVASLRLQDSIRLLGHVSEETLLGWYSAADVFVLPSMNTGWKFEGFGLVYLEASAAGLPVIGTRGCGAEDTIDDGVTGVLVSQERIADELPAALMCLLSDPALRERMGAAGRAKAQLYTWERVAQHMLMLYDNSLSQKAVTP
jgi:glycosyltransferase involved in cell wall biosynthesis